MAGDHIRKLHCLLFGFTLKMEAVYSLLYNGTFLPHFAQSHGNLHSYAHQKIKSRQEGEVVLQSDEPRISVTPQLCFVNSNSNSLQFHRQVGYF